ncbi:hypothetical protein QQ045_030938 [Rhodiola kirilowii]
MAKIGKHKIRQMQISRLGRLFQDILSSWIFYTAPMASDSHTGGPFYGASPYRSREGLSTRSAAASSDEIQLRIDPMHGELDDEITGLHKQIRLLKGV